MMNIHKWQLGFFIGLVFLGLYLGFKTVEPFLGVLFLAIILAIIFYPAHEKIIETLGGRRWIGSALSVFLIFLIVMVPTAFFGFLIFSESTELYVEFRSGTTSQGVVDTLMSNFQGLIDRYSPLAFDIRSYVDVNRYTGAVVSWIADNSGTFVSGILTGALSLLILVLALFYSFKDGPKLVQRVVELSPLHDSHDETILNKAHLAINSVIRGHIIIAIIQGILAGIGFWIFNVPSPAIWGFVAAIASFIPSLGTGLVIAPAVLYLFFTGDMASTIGLLAWGVVVVGFVDNIIGPKLIERGVKIHPFLILIFVLGGIQLFGPIGFIAGPVLLSLLFALFEIYPLMIDKRNNE